MAAIDLNLAQSYLDYLAHDKAGWTFQTFDDNEKKRKELCCVFSTTVFSSVFGYSFALVKLNNAGAGIFVTVNRTDGKGRKAENIIGLRALFVDADDIPLAQSWHETPDMVVQRSEKRWHAYWRVRSDTPLTEFKNAQRRLAAHYGTDPKVWDLPRVMRVPGFLHRKGDATELTLEIAGTDYVRTLAEVMQGVPMLAEEQAKSAPAVKPVLVSGDKRARRIVPSAAPEDLKLKAYMAWAATVATDVVEGQRNHKIFYIACEGHGRNYDKEFILNLCRQCANGLSDAEIITTVNSAFSKPRAAHELVNHVLPVIEKNTPEWQLPEGVTDAGALDKLLDDATSGRRYAVALPWQQLSAATRALLPGTVTILAGPPGSTKSFAVMQCLRFWTENKMPAALMILEYGVGVHARRALAQIVRDSDVDDDEWCRKHPDVVAQYRAQATPLVDQIEARMSALPRGVPKTPEHFLMWLSAKTQTNRVVCIDPITMMEKRKETWLSDQNFLDKAKDIIEENGASLVLVSHPRKMQANQQPTMDDLAGGVVYSRFSQTILYLYSHKVKSVEVTKSMGVTSAMANRTMRVFKANNGKGIEGSKYAMHFDGKTLTLNECGLITEGD